MQHKAWCKCSHCEEGRRLLKSKGRKLPKFVIAQYQEKMQKEEAEMLAKGYILMPCPNCKHTSFMKIGPAMKCEICMHVIK